MRPSVNVDVVGAVLGAFLSAPGTPVFRRTKENSMFLHRDLGANAKTLSFTGPGGMSRVPGADKKELKTRVNGSTGQRARVNGIGLGGQFGGAAPVR